MVAEGAITDPKLSLLHGITVYDVTVHVRIVRIVIKPGKGIRWSINVLCIIVRENTDFTDYHHHTQ